jgi:hypothetical protein
VAWDASRMYRSQVPAAFSSMTNGK